MVQILHKYKAANSPEFSKINTDLADNILSTSSILKSGDVPFCQTVQVALYIWGWTVIESHLLGQPRGVMRMHSSSLLSF